MAKVLKSMAFESGKNQNSTEPAICLLDGDPTAGGGVQEEAGSIGIFVDGGIPKYFKKVGPADTDWIKAFGGGLDFGKTIFADSNADAGGDGSSAFPFKSLQAAIDYVEANCEPFERKTILVGAGSAFDEDILVSGGLLSIMGLGAFIIGDGVGAAFASTTPRNFTLDYTLPQTDGKWETLVLGTIMDEETSSTHTAYNNGVDISGDFIVTNSGGNVGSKNLQLRNVKVRGNFDSSAIPAHAVQTYLRRCFFDNTYNSPSGILNIVESCEFDGLLTALQYNRITFCQIQGGMTVSSSVGSLPPTGIFNTDFSGVFTSANPMQMDAVTNYYFNNNGASLVGGAVKTLLHDLT